MMVWLVLLSAAVMLLVLSQSVHVRWHRDNDPLWRREHGDDR